LTFRFAYYHDLEKTLRKSAEFALNSLVVHK